MPRGINSILVVAGNQELHSKVRASLAPQFKDAPILLCSELGEAINLVRDKRPSVVMLEWASFPVKRCDDFLQKLRMQPKCENTPCIVFADRATGDIASIGVEHKIWKIVPTDVELTQLKNTFGALAKELTLPNAFFQKMEKWKRAIQDNDRYGVERTAIELYTEFPDSHRAKMEYANFCFAKKNYAEAISVASKAITLAPNNLRALNVIVRSYMRLGKFNEAIALMNNTRNLHQTQAPKLVSLAENFFSMRKIKDSNEKFQSQSRKKFGLESALRSIANLELEESQFNAVLEILRDSTEESEVAGLCNNIGIMAARKGNLNQAELAYTTAYNGLSNETLKAKVKFNLGIAYERNKEALRAAAEYRLALELFPEFEKAKKRLNKLIVQALAEETMASEESFAMEERIEVSETNMGGSPFPIPWEPEKSNSRSAHRP